MNDQRGVWVAYRDAVDQPEVLGIYQTETEALRRAVGLPGAGVEFRVWGDASDLGYRGAFPVSAVVEP